MSDRGRPVLVMGLGTYVYGCERQTVALFRHLPHVRPIFALSKYEDGSVSTLLRQHGFEYVHVPFGYLGLSRPWWTLITVVQLPLLFARLVRLVRRTEARAIVTLNAHAMMNAFPVLWWARYLRGLRVVAYFHNAPRGRVVFPRLVGRVVAALADVVVAVSTATRDGLAAIGLEASDVIVVYNGAEPTSAESGAALASLASPWPAEGVVVGFVGQLIESKGLREFVEAAEIVLAQSDRCRFVVVGRSGMGGRYERTIREHVLARGLGDAIVFAGWFDDMRRVYPALDILVVPSLQTEPFGLVNVEAMRHGIPVIASRVGGIPEIVVDRKTGFLVDPGDVAGIADRVLALAADEQLRAEFGAAGRDRAEALFDIERNARRFEEVALAG